MAKVEPRDFIIKWMQAVAANEPGGYGNIADHFDVSRQYVEQYARRLKSAGVKLPKLPAGTRTGKYKIPTQELNDLIDDLG